MRNGDGTATNDANDTNGGDQNDESGVMNEVWGGSNHEWHERAEMIREREL